MTLAAGCPRCASPVTDDDGWTCRDHGSITPLWRPETPDYDSFAEHVQRAGTMPTFLPWPLAPGWAVTDFGCVAGPDGDGRASFITCSGPTDLDGVAEVSLVTEEPGVGLGARCAGVLQTDPGADLGEGPPHAKVRLEGHPVALWSVLTSDADVSFDRSVFAGEAQGRWLWVVLRPASAALMLHDERTLVDIAALGTELLSLPFAGTPPAW